MAKKTNFSPLVKRIFADFPVIEKTEHFNSFSMRKVDLLGVGDFLLIDEGNLILLQVTDSTSQSAHKRKIEKSDKLPYWLSAGGRFWMVYFKKPKHRWVHRIVEYNGTDWLDISDGFTK